DLNNQYTVWTGLIGGFFLQLSYFGTDQSQVGRYLTGSSIRESRMGLIMNGLLKVPMQFCILLIGILVFAYYQFNASPLFFNPVEVNKLEQSIYKQDFDALKIQQEKLTQQRIDALLSYHTALDKKDLQSVEVSKKQIQDINTKSQELRSQTVELLKKKAARAEVDDANYSYRNCVTNVFPKGLIGLLVAIVMLASMGATSSAITWLGSSTVIDIYKRLIRKDASDDKLDL